MSRIVAFLNFLLQMSSTGSNSNAPLMKDVISDTTEAFEKKLNHLIFKLAIGLMLIGVLTYAVIRLIWYLEGYLFLNYGENYAVLLLFGIAALFVIPIIFQKNKTLKIF